jgi:hypothetical protein
MARPLTPRSPRVGSGLPPAHEVVIDVEDVEREDVVAVILAVGSN